MVTELWHTLSDPWSQSIMRHALLEVTLIGLSAGPLGCWVVLYRLSYSAESLAHGMFPGLALAALAALPLVIGGAVGVLVAAVAIALAARVRGTGGDNAVAVVITSLFGLGVLLALSPASPPSLQGLLFGDVLAASDSDLMLAGVLALVIVVALSLLHWRLLAVGFDPLAAGAVGVRSVSTELALLILIALAVLVAVQGLGNLLVVAVLIAPAECARLLTQRTKPMIFLAAAIAAGAGICGLYLSYYVQVAAGASIAGLLVAFYLLLIASDAALGRLTRSKGRSAAGQVSQLAQAP
jgi:ABC-type Mn2+/Zn2+ transport system permease subunit